jgi:predicted metal-dependent phosphoesterase TrpH
MLRADLHVHSWHSGLNYDLPFVKSRDCYSSPESVYRTARARGMDLVTITDHDSIDGCLEFLDRHPDAHDFIIGEEISCWWPGTRLEIHIGAYAIDETIHRDVQPLRQNVHELIAYLRERSVPIVFNHPLHFYRYQVPLEDYLRLLLDVNGVEVRNGAMLEEHNALAERLVHAACTDSANAARLASVGGSDSHTLRRVGRTWTEAPAASREEFLACLRQGTARAGGAHGSTAALACDIYGVIGQYWLALAGLQRNELSSTRRAFGMAFSAVSLPFEFTPLLVSAIGKRRERATVRSVQRDLATPDAVAPTVPVTAEGVEP